MKNIPVKIIITQKVINNRFALPHFEFKAQVSKVPIMTTLNILQKL
jgi:hypothetical protein